MSKILILTPQLPYPPQQGTSMRNYHIIQGLSERHEISLLSFLEEQQTVNPDVIRPLRDRCVRIEAVPVPRRSPFRRLLQLVGTRRPDMAHRLHSPRFSSRLSQLLIEEQFDIVQIEGLELARMISVVRRYSQSSHIVFDDHNAETELQKRAFRTDLPDPRRWMAALYSWFQINRLHDFESWACQEADAVTVVSTADKRTLLSMNVKTRTSISVISNAIDWEQYRGAAVKTNSGLPTYDLLFSGKMDYRPNVDAVLWFADAVWPRIMRERPGTTWAIVGQKPHRRLNKLRRLPGVTLTGWVESVLPFLYGAQIYIMPFRLGSGTRLKLIEAMAAGRSMVSTRIGAEGYPVEDERELLIADDAGEFASAVLHLLENPELRDEMGQRARNFARRYDWRRVVPQFDDVYQRLLRI